MKILGSDIKMSDFHMKNNDFEKLRVFAAIPSTLENVRKTKQNQRFLIKVFESDIIKIAKTI